MNDAACDRCTEHGAPSPGVDLAEVYFCGKIYYWCWPCIHELESSGFGPDMKVTI